MNLVVLCGRVTNDIELKHSSNDSSMAIARYNLAIDDGYGEKKKTQFITCVAFKGNAEFASKYFKKGQRVLVQGKISINEYTDKEGKKKKSFEIVVNSQEFADGIKNDKPSDVADGFVDIQDGDDQDIPFT